MSARNLILLALAALIAGAVAVWALGHRAPQQDVGLQGPLLPSLNARLNAIDQVRIRGAGNAVLATLVRSEAGWSLSERNGYPVDGNKLRGLLLGLAEARRVEAKTANPTLHARLGVEDVTAPDAHGIQVELDGGGALLRVVLGENKTQGAGTYARLTDQAQSWLLDRNLAVERNPIEWLQRDLVAIPTARIASVEVQPASGASIRIARREGAGADFHLVDLPRGREQASDFVADSTAGLLDGLRFDDVLADQGADEGADQDAVRTARFETFEGLSVRLQSWQNDGRTFARFGASLDEDKAAQWAQTDDAAATEGDVDAASTADARLAGLRDELSTLQSRFNGRVFVLPNFKAGNLNRDLEAYLLPKG